MMGATLVPSLSRAFGARHQAPHVTLPTHPTRAVVLLLYIGVCVTRSPIGTDSNCACRDASNLNRLFSGMLLFVLGTLLLVVIALRMCI